MYGLCKVHKYNSGTTDIPLFWPILSEIGIAKYNLAKVFAPFLKEFTVNECTVSDSFSFCKEIIDLTFSHFLLTSLWTKQ